MSKDLNTNIDEARHHFKLNDFKKAETQYLQLLKTTKSANNQGVIWAELSWLYYKTAKYKKAIESADNVIISDEDYKDKASLFRVQGYSYQAIGKSQMAEKYLIQSLGFNSILPEQQYAKYELGKIYFKNGDFDLALPQMEDIRQFFENENQEYFLSILFFLGFIYYYLENLAKAKKCFDEILSSNPSNQRSASALFGSTFIEFRNKNYLKVISLCEKIVMMDVNFFDKEGIGFLTAASYFYLGRIDIFNAYYEKMIQQYPTGKYSQELNDLKNSQNKN